MPEKPTDSLYLIVGKGWKRDNSQCGLIAICTIWIICLVAWKSVNSSFGSPFPVARRSGRAARYPVLLFGVVCSNSLSPLRVIVDWCHARVIQNMPKDKEPITVWSDFLLIPLKSAACFRSPGLQVSRSPDLRVSGSPGLQVFRSRSLPCIALYRSSWKILKELH